MYFSYFAIFGNKGALNYFKIRQELNQKQETRLELETNLKAKQEKINKMQPESLDLDLLDEQTRKNLGHGKENEVVVPF